MIKLFQSEEEILHAAHILMDNHLYVDGWNLRSYVEDIVILGRNEHSYYYGKKCACIALHYDEDVPVAVCVLWEKNPIYHPFEMNFFVLEQFRRKGIATDLAMAVRSKAVENGKSIALYKGNDASDLFFKKLMKENSDDIAFRYVGRW